MLALNNNRQLSLPSEYTFDTHPTVGVHMVAAQLVWWSWVELSSLHLTSIYSSCTDGEWTHTHVMNLRNIQHWPRFDTHVITSLNCQRWPHFDTHVINSLNCQHWPHFDAHVITLLYSAGTTIGSVASPYPLSNLMIESYLQYFIRERETQKDPVWHFCRDPN